MKYSPHFSPRCYNKIWCCSLGWLPSNKIPKTWGRQLWGISANIWARLISLVGIEEAIDDTFASIHLWRLDVVLPSFKRPSCLRRLTASVPSAIPTANETLSGARAKLSTGEGYFEAYVNLNSSGSNTYMPGGKEEIKKIKCKLCSMEVL